LAHNWIISVIIFSIALVSPLAVRDAQAFLPHLLGTTKFSHCMARGYCHLLALRNDIFLHHLQSAFPSGAMSFDLLGELGRGPRFEFLHEIIREYLPACDALRPTVLATLKTLRFVFPQQQDRQAKPPSLADFSLCLLLEVFSHAAQLIHGVLCRRHFSQG